MLTLAKVKDAAASATAIAALETRIAQAQWPIEKARNKDLTYNPKSLAELGAFAPGFPWKAALASGGLDGQDRLVLREADAIAALAKLFRATPVATWRAYMTFHYLNEQADIMPPAFDEAKFEFFGKVLGGVTAAARPVDPRGQRDQRALRGGPAWRGRRPVVREGALHAGSEGGHQADRRQPAGGLPEAHCRPGVDVARDAAGSHPQGADRQGQDRVSGSLEGLLGADHRAWRRVRQPEAVERLRDDAAGLPPERAGGSGRVVAGATDRERVLPRGLQRDRVSRSDPPAAVLRSPRRPGRQLRCRRRRGRPRDGARLRRPGREIG